MQKKKGKEEMTEAKGIRSVWKYIKLNVHSNSLIIHKSIDLSNGR